MRALATSVKTRRLGLCVVPWEVVRVFRADDGQQNREEINLLVTLRSHSGSSLESCPVTSVCATSHFVNFRAIRTVKSALM